MKTKKIFILPIVILVAFVAGYFLMFYEDTLEVTTMKSYKANITKTVEVSGTINSSNVEIINLDPGKTVVKTYVEENNRVEKNQLLSELDTDDLHISLQKAKLNLEDIHTKLNDLSTNTNDFELLNNTVEKGEENYAKLSQDLFAAEEDLKKADILYAENIISKTEHDQYVSAVNNLNSSLKIAELNLKDATVNLGNLQEKKALERLSLERQIKSIHLDIESLNKEIEDTKIYSSIDGIVTEFPLEEGQETLSGEKIMINGISSVELTAFVSQQEAISIKEGQKSTITIDGLSTSYDGLVSFISKVASTDKSTSTTPKVEVRIEITNPDENITFGYEGEARIIIESKDDVLVVKNESVKKENEKEYVYLLKDDVVEKTFVETGLTDGYLIQIKSGIQENDVVIINPPFDLIDGMKVKSVE